MAGTCESIEEIRLATLDAYLPDAGFDLVRQDEPKPGAVLGVPALVGRDRCEADNRDQGPAIRGA